MKRSVIPIFVPHLGCPHCCVFCDQRQISGTRGIPDVKAELEDALAKLERAGNSPRPFFRDALPQAAFYGGSFTAIPPELQEQLLEAGYDYVRRGRLASLRCSTRPDCVDGAVLERLRRYGVATVELGAQSMDPEVLALSRRGHGPEATVQAARRLKEAGFELVLQMMTGLPGDTPEKSRETARRLIALRPDAVRIYPTVVLPDTELERAWRSGRYRPQTVEQAVELCAELLELFETAEIPVIRLGLNPTEELDRTVLAGAYHPALGELARSRMYLEQVRRQLGPERRPGAGLRITAPPRQISAVVGHRHCNVERLKEAYGFRHVTVVPGEKLNAGIVQE